MTFTDIEENCTSKDQESSVVHHRNNSRSPSKEKDFTIEPALEATEESSNQLRDDNLLEEGMGEVNSSTNFTKIWPLKFMNGKFMFLHIMITPFTDITDGFL